MQGASAFHAGELEAQRRAGVQALAARAQRMVRPFLPDPHRTFYNSLPFVVVAARDRRERPWVTLIAGPPGFVTSPDDRTLLLAAQPPPSDALADALHEGAGVGILGIQLSTRRRNRVNGHLRPAPAGNLCVQVAQAFGNCPKYIRERGLRAQPALPPGPTQRMAVLDAPAAALVANADTFFIGSGYGDATQGVSLGMDASHRGGPPGFVRVHGPGRISFPDYAGNNLFNTVGNLTLDPRVGLAFVDFESGGLLQLTGRAEVDWATTAERASAAEQRRVHIDIEALRWRPRALPFTWAATAAR